MLDIDLLEEEGQDHAGKGNPRYGSAKLDSYSSLSPLYTSV
jgi:hypothetical protein